SDDDSSYDSDVQKLNNSSVTWIPMKEEVEKNDRKSDNSTVMYLASFATYKRTKLLNYDDIVKIIRSKNYICEYTSGYVKPYIDFDYKIDSQDYNNRQKYWNKQKKE